MLVEGTLVRIAPEHRESWEPEHGAFWVVVSKKEFFLSRPNARAWPNGVYAKSVASGRYVYGVREDFVLPEDEEEGAST